jgi:GDPmannose 4,6-dehydratase
VSANRALITGITGQDGSYLAELLLEKGYEVHGMVRRSSTESFERIAHLSGRIELHQADLLDQISLLSVLRESRPGEVYNLAAQSFVPTSWVQPSLTGEFTALGVTRMLDALKVTVNYRESFGLFAVSGILFNHESPRRGREFVTRKISEAVAKLSLGLQDELRLGNLDSKRDWGYAPEYVEAMWLMLQRGQPADYVIGTGEHHSPREFVEIAFDHVGLDPADFVRVDPELLRPAEVDTLLADATKAREELGWTARTRFEELVRIMVEADLEAQERSSGRRRGGPGSR